MYTYDRRYFTKKWRYLYQRFSHYDVKRHKGLFRMGRLKENQPSRSYLSFNPLHPPPRPLPSNTRNNNPTILFKIDKPRKLHWPHELIQQKKHLTKLYQPYQALYYIIFSKQWTQNGLNQKEKWVLGLIYSSVYIVLRFWLCDWLYRSLRHIGNISII